VAEPLTLGFTKAPIADKRGMVTLAWLRRFHEYEQKLQSALTILGEIAASAKVEGRSEGIGVTVSQLTSAGLLVDADQVAADGAVFKRVNEPQRTGGGLARQALDDNARLESSLRMNPVDVTAVPLNATSLSNDGVTPLIAVDANSQQVGGVTISWNAGSVDPGVFGTFWVFFDDPTFAGGAVTYQFSDTPFIQAANKGRFMVGKITTTLATPRTGGGYQGGDTPGGAGGRGYFEVS
jgi:hypothetical protein